MKYSNVREYPIVCDASLITAAESGVKRRFPKILLDCSMRQLNNDIIDSRGGGGLLGYRHTNRNDVIISYTMLHSLAPNQLCPMIDHHKIICGCAICNTSKYFQESLNAWRQKQLKSVKDIADNSRGNKRIN